MSSTLVGSSGLDAPILFLKTKSSPSDAYEDLFNRQPLGQCHFEPRFVPVLRHSFKEDGLSEVNSILQNKQINETTEAAYGGMIFTSQRSVEAFTKLVEGGKGC
jgi:uroporphyrinogen-III synthase